MLNTCLVSRYEVSIGRSFNSLPYPHLYSGVITQVSRYNSSFSTALSGGFDFQNIIHWYIYNLSSNGKLREIFLTKKILH